MEIQSNPPIDYINKIFNMDCLAGMSMYPDKSIDMILCDMPYGTTRNKWDTVIPLDKLWEQYKRIIKPNGAIVLTAQAPFSAVLGASNIKWFRYEWIWQKQYGTGFMNAKKAPMKNHENVLVFYNKAPTYNPQMRPGKPYNKGFRKAGNINGVYGPCGKNASVNTTGDRYPTSVLEIKTARNKEKTIHPNQKPVELFEYLIRTYTNPGDLVLDNCMGSGTTKIACLRSERNYTGFETDPVYFDIAINRQP